MNTLNNIKIGKKARVRLVATNEYLRQRLYDIGLIEGSVVRVLHSSPAGDPRAYLVRDSVIALRNCDTEKIYAEVLEDG